MTDGCVFYPLFHRAPFSKRKPRRKKEKSSPLPVNTHILVLLLGVSIYVDPGRLIEFLLVYDDVVCAQESKHDSAQIPIRDSVSLIIQMTAMCSAC